MARSDLLVSLVKAGSSGDTARARAVAEAIIAEERVKRHHVLADRLTDAMRVNGAGSGAAFIGPGQRPQRQFLLELTPRKRLTDLVLTDAARRACEELIEEQHRASVLRTHSLEPRHRVLLVGHPGNGKTSLAEAVAEALSAPFFVVRYEALIGSFLGETASRLKRVFDDARTTPCVLFFDEFDAVGKERGDVHETGEIKRVVSSLLMQVDDLPSYTVVIAATNHAELLDRAAWRRFHVRLALNPPTRRDLAAYVARFRRFARSTAGSDARRDRKATRRRQLCRSRGILSRRAPALGAGDGPEDAGSDRCRTTDALAGTVAGLRRRRDDGWRSSRCCRFRTRFLIDAQVDRGAEAPCACRVAPGRANGSNPSFSVCGTCSWRCTYTTTFNASYRLPIRVWTVCSTARSSCSTVRSALSRKP